MAWHPGNRIGVSPCGRAIVSSGRHRHSHKPHAFCRRLVYFVVGGAGEVGRHVAHTLREEGHAVAIIEEDPKALRRIENLDALIVEGNSASLATLEEASIHEADVFLGLTGHDEVNMVAAGLAKSFGARTIARVNNPQYLDEPATTRFRRIGIDVAICPELVAASKIRDVLDAPNLMSVDVFAENRVHMGELRVGKDAQAVGRLIKELEIPRGVNLIAVAHGGETMIARGDVRLHADDRIVIATSAPEAMLELDGLLGRPQYLSGHRNVHNIMIAGATRIGMHLARLLEGTKNVVLIEEDGDKCKRATEALDKTLIIQGNATDRRILVDEEVTTMDAFVGAHAVEEYNILSCLLAKNMGVPKAVALINQAELRDLVETLDVDLAINPKQSTVGTVLRHVHKADALDVVLTRGGDAQIIELRVHDDSKIAGKTLQKAHLPSEAVVAAIVRGDEVILPRGTDLLLAGDRVVVYTKPEEVARVERLF